MSFYRFFRLQDVSRMFFIVQDIDIWVNIKNLPEFILGGHSMLTKIYKKGALSSTFGVYYD